MKAILVIDMPEDCDACSCVYETEGMFKDVCQVNGKEVKTYTKPSWCPLKPMPQKNEIKNEEEFMNVCGWMYEVQTGMDIGWNDCINEILGETE